jgi:transposase-like protein
MITPAATTTYKNHRFPVEIISYAVWLYFRGGLVMPAQECRELEKRCIYYAGWLEDTQGDS